MPRGLDMSLDELIAKRKKPGGYHGYFRGRGRGRGRGYGPGPTRRLMNRNTVRTAPYSAQPIMQVVRTTVEQEMEVSGGTDTEEGTKLYLSNLDYDVSNSDIELLFSEIGHVKRHTVHYDRSGRSKGTAEVIFVHHSDALAAIEKYNNVQLDGKPLKIELVGVNPVAPISVPPSTRSIPGNPNFVFQCSRGRAGARGLFHGRGAGGFRLARGGGQVKKPSGKVKKPREKVTAEDLDADLENYRLKAMQI
ncbi:hypothetical protein PRUPE_2G231500 [Prunus persica]|uniref:RRM domain-containing protein n=1 Tax=Prunus persica TaxID=3760 RepID=A0A251QNI0_PRUPE|nr:THO complex subunit 4A isoform X1 [Prunus persica]ONI24255.1 hypothetical protein PRUPE_2G231500 [Prunus persica]